MLVKLHKTHDKKLILAIIDDELKGKKFEDEYKQLDLSSEFYNGEKKNKKEIELLLKRAYLINAAGQISVDFLIEKGLADKENIINISGIPHVQILLLTN